MLYQKGKLYSIEGNDLNKLLGKAYELGYDQGIKDAEGECEMDEPVFFIPILEEDEDEGK